MSITNKGKEFLLNVLANNNLNEEKNNQLGINKIIADSPTNLLENIKVFFNFDNVSLIKIIKVFSYKNFILVAGNYNGNGWFLLFNIKLETLKGYQKINIEGIEVNINEILNISIDDFGFIFFLAKDNIIKNISIFKLNDIFGNFNSEIIIFPVFSKILITESLPISTLSKQPIFSILDQTLINVDLLNTNLINTLFYYTCTVEEKLIKRWTIIQTDINKNEIIISNEITLPIDQKYNNFLVDKFDFFTETNDLNKTFNSNLSFYSNNDTITKSWVKKTLLNVEWYSIKNFYETNKNNQDMKDFLIQDGVNFIPFENAKEYLNLRIASTYIRGGAGGIADATITCYNANIISTKYYNESLPYQEAYSITSQQETKPSETISWTQNNKQTLLPGSGITIQKIENVWKTLSNYPSSAPNSSPLVNVTYMEYVTIRAQNNIGLIRFNKGPEGNTLAVSIIGFWEQAQTNLISIYDLIRWNNKFYLSALYSLDDNSLTYILTLEDKYPITNEIALTVINKEITLTTKLLLNIVYDVIYGPTIIGMQTYSTNEKKYINSILLYFKGDYSMPSGINNFLQEIINQPLEFEFLIAVRENNLLLIYNFTNNFNNVIVTNNSYNNGTNQSSPYLFLPYNNVNQNTNIVRVCGANTEPTTPIALIYDNEISDYAKSNNNLIISSIIKAYELVSISNNRWMLWGNSNNELLYWKDTNIEKAFNQIIDLNFDITFNVIDNLEGENKNIFDVADNFTNVFVEQNNLTLFNDLALSTILIYLEDSRVIEKNIKDYLTLDILNFNVSIAFSLINQLPQSVTLIEIKNNKNELVCKKQTLVPKGKLLNFKMEFTFL